MKTQKMLLRENNNDDFGNDINKDNDNIEEQLIDYIINKEIKIKTKWKAIIEKCEPEAVLITEELLEINKIKKYDDIETKLIYEHTSLEGGLGNMVLY